MLTQRGVHFIVSFLSCRDTWCLPFSVHLVLLNYTHPERLEVPCSLRALHWNLNLWKMNCVESIDVTCCCLTDIYGVGSFFQKVCFFNLAHQGDFLLSLKMYWWPCLNLKVVLHICCQDIVTNSELPGITWLYWIMKVKSERFVDICSLVEQKLLMCL